MPEASFEYEKKASDPIREGLEAHGKYLGSMPVPDVYDSFGNFDGAATSKAHIHKTQAHGSK